MKLLKKRHLKLIIVYNRNNLPKYEPKKSEKEGSLESAAAWAALYWGEPGFAEGRAGVKRTAVLMENLFRSG